MAADTSFLGKIDPSVNEQLMTAQQQLALAQALRGHALQPLQAPGGQNGVISPLSALAQALNGYSSGRMMESATHDLATAQSAQAKNQMGMLVNMLRGSGPGATAPVAADGPLSSVPQASTPSVAPAGQPPTPAPGGVPSPMNDPEWQRIAYGEQLGMIPAGTAEGYAKAKYGNAELTPEQKNSRDSVIGPSVQSNLVTQNMPELQRLQRARALLPAGSPQIQEIDDQLAKLNYIAPKDVAPGVLTLDKKNLPLAYNPPAIKGAVPKFQTTNGFTTASSVAPQIGAAAVNANMEGAEQGAKEAATLKTVTNPNGGQTTDWGGRVAGRTGPGTTDAAIQKSTADVIANAPQIVQSSNQSRSGLENAVAILDKIGQSGPGSKQKFNMLGYLNTAGIPLMKGDVDGYQSMQKYLANSLNTAAQGTGASGSDARFDSFMKGQPNGENMGPAALRGAMQYVLSQHDAAVARSQFLSDQYQGAKAQGDPNAALTAQQNWAKVYNPKVFEFSRMTPAERQQYKSSLTPEQQKAFGQQYNFAHEKGWAE